MFKEDDKALRTRGPQLLFCAIQVCGNIVTVSHMQKDRFLGYCALHCLPPGTSVVLFNAQLLGVGYAVSKLNGMGLLPTHLSDYASLFTVPEPLERSSGVVL